MNEWQRANLEKLAKALETVPQEQFGMRAFNSARLPPERAYPCGTVACALGWSPVYVEPPVGYEGWLEYGERVFGIGPLETEWEWCFGGGWRHYDDTPLGASKRIRYMLKHGVPDGFNEFNSGVFINTYQ